MARPKKMRLDALMLERGLADDARTAQGLIMAGKVVVADQRVDKPGALFSVDAEVRLKSGTSTWVSRGAHKLQLGLEQWPFDLDGVVGIDVGASTGGFTQMLLHHGAAKVYAVDVGYGQLAWSLRQDERVVNLERTHIAKLDTATTEPKAAVAVIDVSFTSLLNVMPFTVPHLTSTARVFALIKPQFEVGRDLIEKGGVVRDVAVREGARDDVIERVTGLGFTLLGFADSPIRGADGNVEYMSAWEVSPDTHRLCADEAASRTAAMHDIHDEEGRA